MRISRHTLRRWAARGCASLGLLLLATVGLYRLGVRVTPPGAARPPIYAPAVRRTESYRRQAARWLAALQALDADLVAVLTQPHADVYAQARQAQALLDATVRLSQDVALTYPPASLVGLRDALQLAADSTLDAAAHLNRWVSEPTPARYAAVLEALRVARSDRAVVEANPWLAADIPSPTGTPHPGAPSGPDWGE
jgi:hypothetical protein